MPTLFQHIPAEYVIYFLYGSAFLFLSFAIFTKDMKGSDLRVAHNLWLLALFGLTHGLHEIIELYPVVEGDHLELHQIFHVKLFSLALLIFSFVCLIQFGISLLLKKQKASIWPVVTVGGVVFLLVHRFGESDLTLGFQLVGRVEIAARYFLCLSGSFLTGRGLIVYSRELMILSPSVSRKFRHAGFTFIFYGIVAGLFVSRLDFVYFPFALEILRGTSAMIMAYLINKALNVFDIETRKKIELQTQRFAQTEKLTSLGQLAAGIAHEINNPLTNASLNIQTLQTILKKKSLEKDVYEKLDIIERSLDKASLIAQELLQFSRQKETEFISCNIDRVLTGALTLLQHRLDDITVQKTALSVPNISGDPVKLEQLFINLLSNSVEAMPEGGRLSIDLRHKKYTVWVTISDTGVGIPKKNLSRIFDPFFTTKDIGVGTGLGLSISYGIVKQLKGSIEITSEEGRGTTVSIGIPAGGEE